jgi:hypothetical protein
MEETVFNIHNINDIQKNELNNMYKYLNSFNKNTKNNQIDYNGLFLADIYTFFLSFKYDTNKCIFSTEKIKNTININKIFSDIKNISNVQENLILDNQNIRLIMKVVAKNVNISKEEKKYLNNDDEFIRISKKFIECIDSDIIIIPVTIILFDKQKKSWTNFFTKINKKTKFDISFHENVLIYKKKFDTIEIFEPYAINYNTFKDIYNYEYKEFVEKLNQELTKYNRKIRLINIETNYNESTNTYAYNLGSEQIEISNFGKGLQELEHNASDQTTSNGYCIIWSLLLTELSLKYPNLSCTMIVLHFLKHFKNDGNILRNIIINYIHNIYKVLNIYFNKLYNNNLYSISLRDQVEIFSIFFNIYSSYIFAKQNNTSLTAYKYSIELLASESFNTSKLTYIAIIGFRHFMNESTNNNIKFMENINDDEDENDPTWKPTRKFEEKERNYTHPKEGIFLVNTYGGLKTTKRQKGNPKKRKNNKTMKQR